MKRILFVAAMAVLALTACQKNITDDITPTGGGGTGSGGSGGSGGGGTGGGGGPVPLGLLVKQTIARSANDSTVYEFTYDTDKRVTMASHWLIRTGFSNRLYWTKFKRDATGKVLQVVRKDDLPVPGMADTTVFTIYYAPGDDKFYATKYVYSVTGGVNIYDSSVYTYDVNNRVASKTIWLTNVTTGVYRLQEKYNYTYDANGNLKRQEHLIPDWVTGVLNLYESYDYEYNTRTSPLIMGNESFIDGLSYRWVSKNNPVKSIYNKVTPTAATITGNIAYTHNANNKPVTGTGLYTGTTISSNLLSYYYN